MGTERHRRRRAKGERGAGLLEFALIFPLFMTLALGMFSGGQAYNEKLSITHAAREGVRYSATLPVANFASLDLWLESVSDYVVQTSSGSLGAGEPGWQVCVAYVYPDGTTAIDQTRQRTVTESGATFSSSPCIASDGRPNNERRVQVTAARDGVIQALFFRHTLTLSSGAVARFEASPT